MNSSNQTIARGLRLANLGLGLFFLAGIAAVVFTELKPERFLDSRIATIFFYFLPAIVLDLAGRALCCVLPPALSTSRLIALSSLVAGLVGAVLLLAFVLDRHFDMGHLPDFAGWVGLLSLVTGNLLFVEFLRRIARGIGHETLFWHAIAVLALAFLFLGVLLFLGISLFATDQDRIPGSFGMPGIIFAIIGFLLLVVVYGNLLSNVRKALISLPKTNTILPSS